MSAASLLPVQEIRVPTAGVGVQSCALTSTPGLHSPSAGPCIAAALQCSPRGSDQEISAVLPVGQTS